MNLPTKILDWFYQRTVTDKVLKDFKIGWDGARIVFPVYSKNNKFLFNKYRRDPFTKEGPKYMYDKGAAAALYGLEKIKDHSKIIVTEGEADVLSLWSHGIAAVSSTGGANTFEADWASTLINKQIFICFDNDIAGYKGAFKVQGILPHAKIIWLPDMVGNHGDVTDFFMKINHSEFLFTGLMKDARSYDVSTIPEEEPMTKTQRKEIIKAYSQRVDKVMKGKNDLQAQGENTEWCQVYIDEHMKIINEHRRKLDYKPKKYTGKVPNIEEAKLIPISRFVRFNQQGYALCVFHNERSASMYWYEQQGRVKCFGCGKGGDIVDIVQELYNIGIKQAISKILNV